jgi:hypothetical protein
MLIGYNPKGAPISTPFNPRGLAAARKGYPVNSTRHGTPVMTTLSGKTQNGFTYEGDYEAASGGRILWNATFRCDGAYAGVRHGQLHDMQDVAEATVNDLVKSSVESTWTNVT